MTVPRPSVLIVDDHPVFRFGLAAVLRTRGFRDVAIATGSEPLQDLVGHGVRGVRWVALLDVRLGDRDGIALCRALRGAVPDSVVIMLSTFTEPAIIDAARKAGAFAYLSKEASAEEVVGAIEAGLRGGASRIPDQPVPSLTPRESLVLAQLMTGATNREIASALGIGVDTVKGHLERVYAKLDAPDRLHAVRRAQEFGFGLLADDLS